MSKNPALTCLLKMLDQGFDRKSWHGANLRGSIRGLNPAQAAWRPAPRRHSIADIVLHCAYWKYTVRRRFTGEDRGSFPIAGSNWFKLPEILTTSDWKKYVHLLVDANRGLRAELVKLTDEDLDTRPPKSKVTNRQIIQGIVYHDVYHAGQIQLLKRLQTNGRGE
jgi:uncharacterized damage-inducible protein DinB